MKLYVVKPREWRSFDDEEDVLAALNELGVAPFPFGETSTLLQASDLAFYPNTLLGRAVEYRCSPPYELRFFRLGARYDVLDGEIEPVLRMNAEAPLQLAEGNVLHYVRFYLNHVSELDGAVGPLEDVEDIQFLLPPSPQLKEQVHRLAQKPRIVSHDDAGYVVGISAIVDECLRRLRLKVTEEGHVAIVEMVTDLSELPVAVEPEVH